MNRTQKNNEVIGAAFLYVLCGVFFLLQFRAYTGECLQLYIVLMFAYLWIGGLLVFAKTRYDISIFEPIFFISMLYVFIFVYKPIVDLKTDSMYEQGIYVLPGGVKATGILTASYTIFYISYYAKHRPIKIGRTSQLPSREFEENKLLLGWLIAYCLSIGCMLSQGLSLRYILSLGLTGEKVSDDSSTALLFLSNFGITSITLWLLILTHGKNKAIKVLLTVLETLYLLVRNARWLILTMIMAPTVFYYTKNKKKPNFLLLAVGGVALLSVFAWMQVNRYNLKYGRGYSTWGIEWMTIENLLAPFESDFNTYKTFYSMVTRFPSTHMYMLGISFLYVFVLFVPRAIWKGKPDNPVRTIIEDSLNRRARIQGIATCNLGELYANFGITGCIVGMYFVGWLAAYLKSLFRSDDREKLLIYSIMYPLLFQWIARGNFSGNFYMTVFALLPFILNRVRLKR